jgi:archaellum component FlaC
MANEPDNMVLVYLRRIDERVARLAEDMGDMKVRMTSVEESIVGLQRRMDRLEQRIERIERRLDLTEVPR